jgi:hypothetical protein
MKLTEEQAKQLADLEAMRDAPDEPEKTGAGRVLNFTIDLADDKQVERAFKLGLLDRPEEPAADDEKPPADGEGGEGGEGESPRRRGFFDD